MWQGSYGTMCGHARKSFITCCPDGHVTNIDQSEAVLSQNAWAYQLPAPHTRHATFQSSYWGVSDVMLRQNWLVLRPYELNLHQTFTASTSSLYSTLQNGQNQVFSVIFQSLHSYRCFTLGFRILDGYRCTVQESVIQIVWGIVIWAVINTMFQR
jgi:hypothetical protein